jgi:hypothetical protein
MPTATPNSRRRFFGLFGLCLLSAVVAFVAVQGIRTWHDEGSLAGAATRVAQGWNPASRHNDHGVAPPPSPTVDVRVAAPVVAPTQGPSSPPAIAAPLRHPGKEPAFPPQPPVLLPPRLDAALRIGGEIQPVGASRIALPDGSRFTLRVSATRDGQLEVHAINPVGASNGSPIWQAKIQPGHPVESPMLRLAGVTGLETLRLTLRSPAGAVLASRDIELLHL